MAQNPAYPVDLVENFDAAVQQHAARDFTVRPAATDLMILRALLARPIIEPGESPADDQNPPVGNPIEKTSDRPH